MRTKGIQCDLCAFWFCFNCSKLTDAMYKLLNEKEMPNIKWNCDGCLRVMPSLEGIQGFLREYKADKKVISDRMNSFDSKLTQLQETLDSKVEDKVEKSLRAFRDREERKCNLIIHNLCESDSVDKEARLQYDRSQLESLLDIVGAGDVTVKSFIRLGKRKEEGEATAKPRLILLTVDTVYNKQKILKGAKNLRTKDEEDEYVHFDFANVFISGDLTKEDRIKRHNLRKELKTRKENGETDLVIYGGKIINKSEIQNNRGSSVGNGSSDPLAFRDQ